MDASLLRKWCMNSLIDGACDFESVQRNVV